MVIMHKQSRNVLLKSFSYQQSGKSTKTPFHSISTNWLACKFSWKSFDQQGTWKIKILSIDLELEWFWLFYNGVKQRNIELNILISPMLDKAKLKLVFRVQYNIQYWQYNAPLLLFLFTSPALFSLEINSSSLSHSRFGDHLLLVVQTSWRPR